MAGGLTFIAAFLVATMAVTRAQVPALGPCPEIETMQNFNMQRYLGQWYEAERYFALFEFAGKCVTANYTEKGEGRVNIINRQMSSLTGIRSTIEGEVRLVGRTEESKLSVKFPSLPEASISKPVEQETSQLANHCHLDNATASYVPTGHLIEMTDVNNIPNHENLMVMVHRQQHFEAVQKRVLVDAPYWVLGTDYDNFSVVWSCSNFGLFSARNAWILTRSRHPTLDVMEQAYSVVDKHGISRAYFIRTDQKNCPTVLY